MSRKGVKLNFSCLLLLNVAKPPKWDVFFYSAMGWMFSLGLGRMVSLGLGWDGRESPLVSGSARLGRTLTFGPDAERRGEAALLQDHPAPALDHHAVPGPVLQAR